MIKLYSEIDQKIKMFYQQACNFQSFRYIDEKKIAEIDKLVKQYRDTFVRKSINYTPLYNENEVYTNLLSYLISQKKLTWDEKVLFIIRMYDPELQMLQLYLEFDDIDKTSIEVEGNDYIREDLIARKKNDITNFKLKCRALLKIYDPNLIKYEKILFRVLQTNKLKFGVKRDYLRLFFESYVLSDISLSISDNDLTDIIEAAREYKKEYGIPTINDLAFQLTQQTKKIGIRSAKKAMIFMIYILDENFKAFHIYDEAGSWDMIKKRSISELGFFNKNFILNEVKFDRDNHDDYSSLSLFPRR